MSRELAANGVHRRVPISKEFPYIAGQELVVWSRRARPVRAPVAPDCGTERIVELHEPGMYQGILSVETRKDVVESYPGCANAVEERKKGHLARNRNRRSQVDRGRPREGGCVGIQARRSVTVPVPIVPLAVEAPQ